MSKKSVQRQTLFLSLIHYENRIQLNSKIGEKKWKYYYLVAFSKLSFEGLACNCNYSVLHADSGDYAAVFSLQVCTGLKATATQILSIVLLPVTEKTGPLCPSSYYFLKNLWKVKFRFCVRYRLSNTEHGSLLGTMRAIISRQAVLMS